MSPLWAVLFAAWVAGLARSETEIWQEVAKTILEEASKNSDGRGDLAGGFLAALQAGAGGSADPIQSILGALAGGQAGQSLAALLPALLSQGHEHHEDPALEDPEAHHQHDEATAALLSYLSYLWDRLKETDFAKALWNDSGLQGFMQTWASEAGHFKPDRLFEALSNPSFRRTWMAPVTSSMAHWIYHLNNPDTQHRYMKNAADTINQLLRAQGFVEKELIQEGRPLDESLSKVVDTLFFKQLGLEVSSSSYIKPMIAYFTDVLRIGQGSVSGLTSKDIEDRLTDTLNIEVVDSIMRVYRGYKYTLEHHRCDKQILCQLNQPPADSSHTLSPGVTKVSSLVSAWFLSGHTGTPFLTLYNAMASQYYNCQKSFPAECESWHLDDIRRSTDYSHNEL